MIRVVDKAILGNIKLGVNKNGISDWLVFLAENIDVHIYSSDFVEIFKPDSWTILNDLIEYNRAFNKKHLIDVLSAQVEFTDFISLDDLIIAAITRENSQTSKIMVSKTGKRLDLNDNQIDVSYNKNANYNS